MRNVWFIIHLVHAVLAGDLYSPAAYSPAVGIAYSAPPVIAPQPISPLHYTSPLRSSVGYGPLAAARFNQVVAPPLLPAAPAPISYAPAAPVAYAPPAPVVAKYAAPIVSKYAAVPAVADIPITRYEAQPGYIQKYVDVAHPKIATSKIQIRRPAIQKQFYDIEERIIVRPIASAVVELDQPLSKTQSGPTVVSPALHGPIHGVPAAFPGVPVPVSGPAAPLPPVPTYGPPSPPPPPSAPESPEFPEISSPGNGQDSDDSDSITVENENARARSRVQVSNQERQPQPQPQPQQQPQPQPQQDDQNQQNEEPQTEQPEPPQSRSGPIQPPLPQTQARFLSRPQISLFNNFAPEARSYPDVIPSSRTSLTEEQSQTNQQRLIELLTGRGGVAEVRSGISVEAAGEAGQIRGRVLSVTPAPPNSGSADEKVSTRRVVVSRPIQTLQEVDVVQPFTKLQRLSVQHPALFKTQRVDIARVKTIAPVPVTSYASYPYAYVH